MQIRDIVTDVTGVYLSQGHQKFWEEDEELINVLSNLLNPQPIENGADMFSVTLAVLVESSAFFKQIAGRIQMALWKPTVKNVAKKIFSKLKTDYSYGIIEFRKQYQAPMPEVLVQANDLLNQIKAYIPLREEIEADEEAEAGIVCIRNMASGCMDELLSLFKQLYDHTTGAMNNTPYMTGLDAIDYYRQIVAEGFDILLKLSGGSLEGNTEEVTEDGKE